MHDKLINFAIFLITATVIWQAFVSPADSIIMQNSTMFYGLYLIYIMIVMRKNKFLLNTFIIYYALTSWVHPILSFIGIMIVYIVSAYSQIEAEEQRLDP